ncbi:hypothetical protein I4I84_33480, partial [Pseudonocardia sp. KRD-182]
MTDDDAVRDLLRDPGPERPVSGTALLAGVRVREERLRRRRRTTTVVAAALAAAAVAGGSGLLAARDAPPLLVPAGR